MEENLDPLSPILPIDFFNTQIDLHQLEKGELKKKHLLPNFSDLLAEDHFADVSMGWEQKGIHFAIEVNYPFDEGDRVELFIDTRDLKTAGFVTRFCHHFLIEGTTAQEITIFRTDDKHELCEPGLIEVRGNFPKKNYTLEIFIPSECLHGYDPGSFDRLGFAYRICRKEGNRQHLSLSSDYFAIEKEPSLWSSLLFK